MSYVQLSFPDIKNFIKYVSEKVITRVGKVVISGMEQGEKEGEATLHLYYRLTAKDVVNTEIIICDFLFYKNTYLGGEAEEQKTIDEATTKFDAWLKNELSQFLKAGGELIDGEFKTMGAE